MTQQKFIKFDSQTKRLICQGEWTLNHLLQLKKEFSALTLPTTDKLIIDGNSITRMDSAGAWLLNQWKKEIAQKNLTIEVENFSEEHEQLFSLIEKQTAKKITIPQVTRLGGIAKLGKITVDQLQEIYHYLSFIGALTIKALWVFTRPKHMRWREVTGLVYKAGFQALPIITLISFMVGVVLAHETGVQLKKYGANIFIVELIGYGVLREFGPLITAIMVAGRTGSAFTAQLGTMKINQEIDALNTMSITPAELLLLPRMIALLIALPLLTIWADIFCVMGGMLVTENILHLSWYEFLYRFQLEVPLREFFAGLGKAPIFALIIASIGCFQGVQVRKNAESLGRLTTRSVVLSIFFIIIADAIFSVLYSIFKVT